VVRLLLEKGANVSADVDWAKYNGRTPLSYVAKNGHEYIVQLLLKAEADVEAADCGRTPLTCA
jgi:ankyrin repeat protein